MIGRTALVRTTNRAVTRRAQSTGASPKMHRAKDAWAELEATRAPKDHDDHHVSRWYSNTIIGFYFRIPINKSAFLWIGSWCSTLPTTLRSPPA
jgi:hypothetical protein